MRAMLRKHPEMARVMADRHKMYAFQREYVFACERMGNTLVLCPDMSLEISRTEHDPDRLQAAYDEGRKVATRELDRIKEFIK